MSHEDAPAALGAADTFSAASPDLVLQFDKSTVPIEAIERALYALADQLTGTIVAEAGCWAVSAYARSELPDGTDLAHRVRQEVNDQTLRVRIAERTDPLRNLVFALAFSRSGLVQQDADQ
jgi:His-Xaa-Ser system protein HxsD